MVPRTPARVAFEETMLSQHTAAGQRLGLGGVCACDGWANTICCRLYQAALCCLHSPVQQACHNMHMQSCNCMRRGMGAAFFLLIFFSSSPAALSCAACESGSGTHMEVIFPVWILQWPARG